MNICKKENWLRLGSAPPDRTPCPSRMSALEQSIRNAEEPTKNLVRPTLGPSFDSLGNAYDFYNLYSWDVFGIRYGKSCSVGNAFFSNIIHFRVNVFCCVIDVLSKRGTV